MPLNAERARAAEAAAEMDAVAFAFSELSLAEKDAVAFSELSLWGFAASVEVGKVAGNVGAPMKHVIQSTTNQSTSVPGWLLQSEVHHVADPTLQAVYERKKRQLAVRLGAANVNEQFLFHGTTFENSEGIINKNFCLTKVGTNMGSPGAYGRGFYFTKCPGYAIRHCGGKHVLLLCKVLLGNSHDMRNLPKSGCPRNPGFDSHISSSILSPPSEVVVFEPEQVLPVYRITPA